MQKIKSEKGVTLVVLMITVIILLLISVPIIVNTTDVQELQRYSYFKSDIDKLREAIETAYMDSSDIMTIGPRYVGDESFLDGMQGNQEIRNPNDNAYYYVISLKNLNSYTDSQISLRYGSGNKQETYDNNEYNGSDVYIINANSKTIYYTPGIEYKGTKYYRLPEKFTKQEAAIVVSYDANGGEDAPIMRTYENSGTTIIIGDAPKRNGYNFLGYLDEYNNIIYQPGDEYTVTETVTFIAQWEEDNSTQNNETD